MAVFGLKQVLPTNQNTDIVILIEFNNFLIYITGFIYFVTAFFGLMICVSAVNSAYELADEKRANGEHTLLSVATRFIFGVLLLGNNALALALINTLGAEASVSVDPYSMLNYADIYRPSNEQLQYAMLIKTFSRTLGAWAFTSGIAQGRHINHPQEQARKGARTRLFWGYSQVWFSCFPN